MPSSTIAKARTHQGQLTELRRQVRSLRQQLQRAQRLATVGTMAAMVAHEFNNILTPIINYAQMAQRNPAFADKAIARAAEGGQRASHICKAILGIAKDGPAPHEAVGLRELVEDTLAAIARDPSKDGIELELSVPEDLTVRTRRVELQHVLLNLLLNARTAVMASDGVRQIEVAAGLRGRSVWVQVIDNGVGIPPEDLKRIFMPFFSTKTPTEGEHGGHGLGLTICKEIVEDLHGRIAVRSSPGKGATFTILLPA